MDSPTPMSRRSSMGRSRSPRSTIESRDGRIRTAEATTCFNDWKAQPDGRKDTQVRRDAIALSGCTSSVRSLEVAHAGLVNAGRNLNVSTYIQGLEAIHDKDTRCHPKLSFGPKKHQGATMWVRMPNSTTAACRSHGCRKATGNHCGSSSAHFWVRATCSTGAIGRTPEIAGQALHTGVRRLWRPYNRSTSTGRQ